MPRVSSSDEGFKKPEQVIGHPEVTDHNINDEYMRDPPDNLKNNPTSHWTSNPGLKEGRYEVQSVEEGVTGAEELGRAKKSDNIAMIAQEDSVHP